jgi:uncharacterized glyoxalase superfamily protein PhnB
MEHNEKLVPLLVVRGAARAIDFCARALGATVLARYEQPPGSVFSASIPRRLDR